MSFKIDERDSRTVARLKMLYLVPLLMPLAAVSAAWEFLCDNAHEIRMIWNHKPKKTQAELRSEAAKSRGDTQ